jgi:hypothetical protein
LEKKNKKKKEGGRVTLAENVGRVKGRKRKGRRGQKDKMKK